MSDSKAEVRGSDRELGKALFAHVHINMGYISVDFDRNAQYIADHMADERELAAEMAEALNTAMLCISEYEMFVRNRGSKQALEAINTALVKYEAGRGKG